jgi:uroporphyrinogen decarboxylase
MNSRERILQAINHKEADKLPVDCGAMRSTGIMGIPYNSLKKNMGIQGGRTLMYDMAQQLSIPEPWYKDRFQIDTFDLSHHFANDPSDWIPWTLPDGSEAFRPSWITLKEEDGGWVNYNQDGEEIARMTDSTAYFSQTLYPLRGKGLKEFNDLPAYLGKSMWNSFTDPLWRHSGRPDFYDFLKKEANQLRGITDKAVMLGFGGNLFEMGQFLYGTDDFLVNLMIEEQEMESLLDKIMEIHLENLGKVLNSLGDSIDIIQLGDDLGTQSSLMISPELYRKSFLKRHKILFDFIHKNSNAKVFLHSCGAIAPLIPDLIDAGVDILNPVQIGASGMNPVLLKKEYGKDLVFWGGGIDTQHTLPNGTVAEVKDAVKKNCEILMKDGGFVFNQVHNIVAGITPENIIAMYDTANSIRY